MNLSLDDYHNLRDLTFEKTGIFFEDKRIYFFKKRLESRMNTHGFSAPNDYYNYLKYGKDNSEFDKFINLLTTNETYFFREMPQLKSFSEDALVQILEEKKKINIFSLNIWSAACSTGDEPYTLAMMLREKIPDFSRWRISITATDIDTNVLEKAKLGVYSPRAIKDVPAEYLSKYFLKENSDYVVKPEIRRMVSFKRVNLISPFQMKLMKNMDFIFCRNVLIYFNDDSRKTVLNYFYNSMNKGAFIFLGFSESVGRISAAFSLVRLKNGLTYRK